MTTFSQIVDEVTKELIRPDLRLTLASYLNQVIRECHMTTPGSGLSPLPVLFGENRIEDEFQLVALPGLWPIPNVPRFQKMETAQHVESGRFYVERSPLKLGYANSFQAAYENMYAMYRTGSSFAFTSFGVGETLRLSWFEYVRNFKYYVATDRPVQIDDLGTETFHADYNGTPILQQNARDLCTSWIILRHEETLKQGLRSKHFARIGEMERARLAYAGYEAAKIQLQAAEAWSMSSEN